jgi:hypothetical protein
VDPLENRCKEEEARALATRELLNCIVGHRMAVDSLTGYEKDAVSSFFKKSKMRCDMFTHHVVKEHLPVDKVETGIMYPCTSLIFSVI